MLIEFSVANYRSFRDRQTLSMVAAPRLRRRENTFLPALSGEKFPALLKACVIYGPNASGKSNLVRALGIVEHIMRRSPENADARLPVEAFAFDPALRSEPSRFDLHFIHQGMRYEFRIALTAQRIVHERLAVYKNGHEELLYERLHSANGDAYEFGRTLEGGAELHETWRLLTPPTAFFISQAVKNSNESLTQLRAPLEWLRNSSFVIGSRSSMSTLARATRNVALKDDEMAGFVAKFLRDVDVPISRIRVLPPTEPESDSDMSSPTRTLLTHKTALGEAELSFEDQSEGTKNLMGFWLPWTTRTPYFGSRCVLVVDELDNSLHPSIVEALVSMHIASEMPSQLIFTTHDTHLMDAKLLRRDQFWIAERDSDGATQLRSIYDFEGREGEDIEKRYFEGRYRGLPLVRKS